MKKLEKLKIFAGGDSRKLEAEYNGWYAQMVKEREGHLALRGMPFQVTDRKLEIRNYDGEETYCLAIWYQDVELEEHEKGSMDRGGRVNGVSMVGQR